jgi:hypothetical protein
LKGAGNLQWISTYVNADRIRNAGTENWQKETEPWLFDEPSMVTIKIAYGQSKSTPLFRKSSGRNGTE